MPSSTLRVVNRDDVRMAERAGGPYLPRINRFLNSSTCPGPVTSSRTVFTCDLTANVRIDAAVDDAHAAFAQLSDDCVPADWLDHGSADYIAVASGLRSGDVETFSLRSRFRVDCLCRAPGVEARRQESQCDTKVDGIRSARLGAGTPTCQQLPSGWNRRRKAGGGASRGVGTRQAESLRHAGHVAHLSLSGWLIISVEGYFLPVPEISRPRTRLKSYNVHT